MTSNPTKRLPRPRLSWLLALALALTAGAVVVPAARADDYRFASRVVVVQGDNGEATAVFRLNRPRATADRHRMALFVGDTLQGGIHALGRCYASDLNALKAARPFGRYYSLDLRLAGAQQDHKLGHIYRAAGGRYPQGAAALRRDAHVRSILNC